MQNYSTMRAKIECCTKRNRRGRDCADGENLGLKAGRKVVGKMTGQNSQNSRKYSEQFPEYVLADANQILVRLIKKGVFLFFSFLFLPVFCFLLFLCFLWSFLASDEGWRILPVFFSPHKTKNQEYRKGKIHELTDLEKSRREKEGRKKRERF
jgi:hypothetical protein